MGYKVVAGTDQQSTASSRENYCRHFAPKISTIGQIFMKIQQVENFPNSDRIITTVLPTFDYAIWQDLGSSYYSQHVIGFKCPTETLFLDRTEHASSMSVFRCGKACKMLKLDT